MTVTTGFMCNLAINQYKNDSHTTGFMCNIAINQYKNVKSTLEIPNNLIIYLTSRCVF
jgi:hypothetical protein